MKPKRIQRKRTKGWKMPQNTLCATRPGKFGNPFRVGVYVKIGDGKSGFNYLICREEKYAGPGYVYIDSAETAVHLFREYRRRYPFSPEEVQMIRNADHVACFCNLGSPCHVDVLLEIANSEPAAHQGDRE